MERFKLASITAGATAAVLAGSVGVAMAVAAPAPPAPMPVPVPEPPMARPVLTARATVSSVGAWEQFRVYGVGWQLAPGTKVTLQQRQGGRWVTLPASMNTTQGSTYKMRVLLGIKGLNELRMIGGGIASDRFTVTVH
ncbi:MULTISPECIES: hypothetical protein [unclassified Streptomyces]|uniref:hypothetical protein n=1 Tax=unclassified Streptomyces TaxID=2593676 RepID=UPI002DD96F3F|nr:hypothetical protein [Streptomyces sp. NBC_01750]WSA99088.1 hypothetical protein OIE54_07350 [Streptomyces sp. NBC_01794]WSD36347.1 hypothetical protein OG966_33225 [Streptomyces sp. NBC_01750]